MAPFVSVVSPTLTGYVTDYLTRSNRTRTPYAAVLRFARLLRRRQPHPEPKGALDLALARALIGISTGTAGIGSAFIMRELRRRRDEEASVRRSSPGWK